MCNEERDVTKRNNMTEVLHICGSVGAGKSTLLSHVQKTAPKADTWVIQELDDWAGPLVFQSNMWKTLRDETSRGQYYEAVMRDKLASFLRQQAEVKDRHVIILVGLTMWIASDTRTAHLVDVGQLVSKVLPRSQFTGFFLRIDDKQLVKQNFDREFAHGGPAILRFDASRIVDYAQLERKEYVDRRHYSWATSDDIYAACFKALSPLVISQYVAERKEATESNQPLIHISGSPGSGKTTLGTRIAKLFGDAIVCVDTDNFIQQDNEQGQTLARLDSKSSAFKQVWTKILDVKFAETISNAHGRPVVFVGSLDNAGPADGTIYEFRQATVRLYLSPPFAQVLKQFYSRFAGYDDEFWTSVVNLRDGVPDSQFVLQGMQTRLTWHQQHGYRIVTNADMIFDIVTRVLTSFLPQSDAPECSIL